MRFTSLLVCSLLSWPVPAAQAQLVPELRVPTGEDPDAAITEVAHLEIDRLGRIYVAEPTEATV
jgi:hypothetical protein